MANSSVLTRVLRIAPLLAAYASHERSVIDTVEAVIARIQAIDRPEIFTRLVSNDALRKRADALDAMLIEESDAVFRRYPLFGVPFAVKDNVDVAGMPTTAACEPFAYTPDISAFGVQCLLDAGAILIGKTNLDQFATGLVGTRSPYGAVRQVDFPERVSGGSSSGSAVSVAAGCVAFSLGTDTAGSGRVPAGFNGLVGLKPSLGLVSKRGVVPACRTLDTLSIFAHDVADAWRVLTKIARYDALDPYSRKLPALGSISSGAWRVGVPAELEFFNDRSAQRAFAATLDTITGSLALTPQPLDFTPFKRVSALLYDGPWVAERRAALGAFFETNHADIDKTVAAVIGQADRFSAVDAFNAQYALADLKREVDALFEDIDVMIVPTTPTHPLIADVQANPIELNSQLGVYTNFVNLLDLCALAVPGLTRDDGLPAGVTLIGPSGADHRLALLGARIESLFSDTPGIPDLDPLPFAEPSVVLAVVGAHLRGQPLNRQLREAGARFIEATHSAPVYRLYALARTSPPKPGLVRVSGNSGAAIAVELWDVPLRSFGQFVADVPAPMGIGSMELPDGRVVKGFICEPDAVSPASGATDITAFGGWLAYLDSIK